ncbi:MAG: protease complex subunit PrcB family protein [Bacteroidota bacterium]
MKKWIFLWFGVFGIVSACQSSKGVSNSRSKMDTVTFEVISSGSQSAMEQEGVQLIDNETSWLALWKEVHHNQFPVPESISVDFSKYQVIAIFMGMKTTGGYQVKAESLQLDSSTFRLQAIYELPGKNCMLTEALTYPFLILKTPRQSAQKVDTQITRKQIDC